MEISPHSGDLHIAARPADISLSFGNDKEINQPRRNFLKALGLTVPIGAAAIIDRLHAPEIADYHGPVNFVPGNHELPLQNPDGSYMIEPEGNFRVPSFVEFQKTGSVDCCTWGDITTETRQALDTSMREAARYDKYFCGVDGIGVGTGINWVSLPRPLDLSLSQKENYAKHMYVVGTDLADYFGVDTLAILQQRGLDEQTILRAVGTSEVNPIQTINNLSELHDLGQQEQYDRFNAFKQELRTLCSPYKKSLNEAYNDQFNQTTTLNFVDSILQTGAIVLGVKLSSQEKLSRRKILGTAVTTLISVVGVQGLKELAAANSLSYLIGDWANKPQWFKDSVETVASMLPETSGDPTADLYRDARTALAVEKLEEVSAKFNDGKPVDMLYGNMHHVHKKEIFGSKTYRKALIQAFTKNILTRIDSMFSNEYADLQEFRHATLSAVGKSISTYTLSEINLPWGIKAVETNEESMNEFNNNLIANTDTYSCKAIEDMVQPVLQEFALSPILPLAA